VTPEFPYQEIIDPELGGPWYDVCDVIEVEAETERDALLLGVHAMSEDHREYKWCRNQREEGLSPFAGVKVYPVPDDAEGGGRKP